MLRVDPRARGRLEAIIANLRDRIDEGRLNGWDGEVQGLQTSLSAAAAKVVSLDRATRSTAQSATAAGGSEPVYLGISIVRQAPHEAH